MQLECVFTTFTRSSSQKNTQNRKQLFQQTLILYLIVIFSPYCTAVRSCFLLFCRPTVNESILKHPSKQKRLWKGGNREFAFKTMWCTPNASFSGCFNGNCCVKIEKRATFYRPTNNTQNLRYLFSHRILRYLVNLLNIFLRLKHSLSKAKLFECYCYKHMEYL